MKGAPCLLLTCPCCGVTAEETEFAPGGEAHLKRLSGPGSSDAEFDSYMFNRKKPARRAFRTLGACYGCGKWFSGRGAAP